MKQREAEAAQAAFALSSLELNAYEEELRVLGLQAAKLDALCDQLRNQWVGNAENAVLLRKPEDVELYLRRARQYVQPNDPDWVHLQDLELAASRLGAACLGAAGLGCAALRSAQEMLSSFEELCVAAAEVGCCRNLTVRRLGLIIVSL